MVHKTMNNNTDAELTATSHLCIQTATKVSIHWRCGCIQENSSTQQRTTSATHSATWSFTSLTELQQLHQTENMVLHYYHY